ncbi:RdgB/HAM1 family non-canonical purine NTP pyrophosphatase [Membranicola marinus]|uniref:dITP/XTP pyrophosphatase n=1 Tax=Membranihabitans marinus TaxID=1227546 RepID=A0A953HPI9_9BACT|nr:RdgB/HAM1 family non-canonical purine NTP pyrophosphatase [Membranihabitans marinus]MBY5958879.1 RdgB/HAM1 family non-canonical purine NTP pyrophosphatase [Membranihabitans marinus]
MNKQLLFATSNPHKLHEVRNILDSMYVIDGLDTLEFEGDIPETQDTIEGNAIQKVQFISDYTDRAVFAEDTGLLVDALEGAPGVHSARYAGDQRSASDNMNKLLWELQSHPNRKAHFKTIVAYLDPTGKLSTFEGIMKGEITTAPRGKKGFGYDPIFQPEGYDKTFGELDEDIKNEISHRAKAMAKFLAFLKQKSTG